MILSRQDLSNEQNRKDCAEEFRAALNRGDDGSAIVRWARKWDDGVLGELENPEIGAEDVKRAEKEATEFEDRIESLETTIQEAIEQMDITSELSTGAARAARYLEISIDLEKALTK